MNDELLYVFDLHRLEYQLQKHYLIVGIYFGGFQALMPTIGYFIGITFASFIASIDHWIAFILLSLIGLKMIKESLENENCD
ncbi:manganese efflux pump MntP family protein, partial [Campylobacter jejuni]|uniref:manganese efflux pump n=1 Tax=Campylobacter jejuni TaxID=197 RepID=UPI001EDA6C6D